MLFKLFACFELNFSCSLVVELPIGTQQVTGSTPSLSFFCMLYVFYIFIHLQPQEITEKSGQPRPASNNAKSIARKIPKTRARAE